MDKHAKWDLLLRSIERQDPQRVVSENKEKVKRGRPEKLVEAQCLAWAKKNECFLHVVDSSNFDAVTGQTIAQKAQGGFSDLCGNNNHGHSLWIELKAKDRRSTVSVQQYHFLKQKIEQKCFAVVVDSSDLLNDYYYTWAGAKNRESYLLSILPVPKAIRLEAERFDPELGF